MGEVIKVEFGLSNLEKEEGEETGVAFSKNIYLDVFKFLLDEGKVMVHFLTDTEGVDIPKYLKEKPQCALNFCYSYGDLDLTFDEWGVKSMLQFNGTPIWCEVPWKAVGAFVSHPLEQLFIVDARRWDEIAKYLQEDDA